MNIKHSDRIRIGFLAILSSIHFYACEDRGAGIFPLSGGNWKFIGPEGIPVNRMVLNGKNVYVCGGSRGLWKKNIRNNTAWEYLGFADTTLTEYYWGVTDVAPQGFRLMVSYIGNDLDAGIGLWQSMDDGKTFSRADSGIFDPTSCPHPYINSVELSPFNGNKAIATAAISMYKTTDGGASWQTLIDRGCNYNVFFENIVWHPNRANSVWYFGSSPGLGYPFLIHSDDDGQNWRSVDFSQLGIGTYGAVRAVFFDASDTSTAYISIPPSTLKTTDGGSSWFFIQALYTIAATDPNQHNVLYLLGPQGLYRSLDGGQTVQKFSELPSAKPSTIQIDRHSTRIFMGSLNGIYEYDSPLYSFEEE